MKVSIVCQSKFIFDTSSVTDHILFNERSVSAVIRLTGNIKWMRISSERIIMRITNCRLIGM